ncbi:MAG: hypothetical protein HGB30_00840 [Holophagaceae bacterium]|nr:hypothetical protein [Holophagaceae bacterium]
MLLQPRPSLAIVLLATLFACGGGGGGTTAAPPAMPSFALALSPASLQVPAGSSAVVTVTVSRLNGFKGDIALAGLGLPAGVTASGLVPDGALTHPLTVQVGTGAAQATFPDLHIEGRAGGVVQVAAFTLLVRAPVSLAQGTADALQAPGGHQQVGSLENLVVVQEPLRALSAVSAAGSVQVRHGFLPTGSPQKP